MIVTLNGERREVPGGATVASLVSMLGSAGGRGVAVALGGEVVPRAEWEATQISDGAHVEIVAAIQGG